MTQDKTLRKAPTAKKAATATRAAKVARSPVEPAAEAHPQGNGAADMAAGVKKQKLVRDSFTIPKNEYAVLESLKQRAMRLERSVKKSELLRAGIAALNTMPDKAFLKALDAIPSLKTGRPKIGPAAD